VKTHHLLEKEIQRLKKIKRKEKEIKNMSITQCHAVAIIFLLAAYILGMSELF